MKTMTQRVMKQVDLECKEICEKWVEVYEVKTADFRYVSGRKVSEHYTIPGAVVFILDGEIEGNLEYCPNCLKAGENCVFEVIAGNIYDTDTCPRCGMMAE